MNSSLTMYILIGFYTLIVCQALWEHNWWRAVYFVGAIIISIAVLAMTLHPRAETLKSEVTVPSRPEDGFSKPQAEGPGGKVDSRRTNVNDLRQAVV